MKYLDSYLALLSVPAVWPALLKWCVPIPAAVVPNPTILDLTLTSFEESLEWLNDKILELISEVNVPIKLPDIELVIPLSA